MSVSGVGVSSRGRQPKFVGSGTRRILPQEEYRTKGQKKVKKLWRASPKQVEHCYTRLSPGLAWCQEAAKGKALKVIYTTKITGELYEVETIEIHEVEVGMTIEVWGHNFGFEKSGDFKGRYPRVKVLKIGKPKGCPRHGFDGDYELTLLWNGETVVVSYDDYSQFCKWTPYVPNDEGHDLPCTSL